MLILSGSQQGLDLAARALVNPGDTVVVEEPSYFGALQVFRSARARLVGVPIDEAGLRTDILARVLEHVRPTLIYTLPTFQNPSGAVMSLARRRELLTLAARHGVPVLEDDPYSELRYEGTMVPSLKALDGDGLVLHLGTFSKVLFPGLRLGWLVAPRPVVRRLALLKQAMDLHSNTPGQYVLERFIRRSLMNEHLHRLRRAYTQRRNAMEEALRRHTDAGVTWRKPSGGFYFWCRPKAWNAPAPDPGRRARRGVSARMDAATPKSRASRPYAAELFVPTAAPARGGGGPADGRNPVGHSAGQPAARRRSGHPAHCLNPQEEDIMIISMAKRMNDIRASEIRELLKFTARPEVISFAGGLPAPELFPVREIEEAAASALEHEGARVLQYSTPEGDPRLREIIAARMNRVRKTHRTADEVLVTSGSQQGLDLTGKIFLDPGDVILCESPTYIGAIQAFRVFNPASSRCPPMMVA